MFERKYMRVDIDSIIQSISDKYQLPQDVMKLVELDLCSGMTKEQVLKYCTKPISVGRMKVISDCIRKGCDADVIKKLSKKERSNEVMEVVFKLLDKGVEISTFEDKLEDSDRLLEFLNEYIEKLTEKEKEEEPEELEEGKEDIHEDVKSEVQKNDQNENHNEGAAVAESKNRESAKLDKEASKTIEESKVPEKKEDKNVGLFVGKTSKTVSKDSDEINKVENEDDSSYYSKEKHTNDGIVNPTVDSNEIKALIASLKDEIMTGLSSAIDNSSKEDQIQKEYDQKLSQVEAMLKEKENQLAEQSKCISEMKRQMAAWELESEERLRKALGVLMKEAEKNNDSNNPSGSSDSKSDETLDLTKNHETSTDMQYRTLSVTDSNGRVIGSLPVEKSVRKSSALGGIAATLGFKKRSRRSLMQLAINGELCKEQLIHIVEAIKSGLTENQLCNLIENKVPAERMSQIIQIAMLENQMGYNG